MHHGYGISNDNDARNLAELLNILANNIDLAFNALSGDEQAVTLFRDAVGTDSAGNLSITPSRVIVNQASALRRVATFVRTGSFPLEPPERREIVEVGEPLSSATTGRSESKIRKEQS